MKFFKTFLASVLGTFVALFLLFLIFFAALVSSSSETEPYIRSNTVLKFDLVGNIPARAFSDPFEELITGSANVPVSLETLRNNLEKAASDETISAVWVKTNFINASWANLQTAYKYFETFKDSTDKPLYFSTDDIGFNEKSYYLATLADSVFSPPVTNFEFDGFVSQFTFYKPMLDKIGIEPEIFRVGKYKSAVEPFTSEESSPESRMQTRMIMDAAMSTYTAAVSQKLGTTPEEVNNMLNTPPVDRVNYALENGLLDALVFENDVEQIIKNRIGLDEDDELNTVSYSRYSKVSNNSAGLETSDSSDKIAVIYTSGMILPNLPDSPFGNNQGITPASVKKQLDDALDDSNTKAIVIHINSPGGSATSSDLIWNSIKEASDKVPVIASMGSVAASGGYYMAMGADTVLASKNTITGSIGIFNLLFNAEELFNENIGILYETMKTHEYADLFDLTRPFTNAERNVIQQNVELGYETFLNRVAEARGMTRDEVHEHAQGRVFTGADAHEVGLVDILGDLDDAIAVAAGKAGIEDYRVETYPKKEDIFASLFGTAETKVQAMLSSWMPSSLIEESSSFREILNQPSGQNWMLLPGKFDVE
jgi:protease-4